jgi:hypothetical protein
VANLIVAETAERWRINLSFWEYTKSGVIITLVTLAIAVGWLYFWSFAFYAGNQANLIFFHIHLF